LRHSAPSLEKRLLPTGDDLWKGPSSVKDRFHITWLEPDCRHLLMEDHPVEVLWLHLQSTLRLHTLTLRPQIPTTLENRGSRSRRESVSGKERRRVPNVNTNQQSLRHQAATDPRAHQQCPAMFRSTEARHLARAQPLSPMAATTTLPTSTTTTICPEV